MPRLGTRWFGQSAVDTPLLRGTLSLTSGALGRAPPQNARVDGGGEFEREFRQECESMSINVSTSAAHRPQQIAIAERHGGSWKHVARALIDEFSTDFNDARTLHWLCVVANWALNSRIGESGFSPSQWVIGRGVRLPYSLLSNMGRLSLHERLEDDVPFQNRVAMISAAQRAVSSVEFNRALSRAALARSRASGADPVQTVFSIGDQVYYWRKNPARKRAWITRWHGPALVIGFESNNL